MMNEYVENLSDRDLYEHCCRYWVKSRREDYTINNSYLSKITFKKLDSYNVTTKILEFTILNNVIITWQIL